MSTAFYTTCAALMFAFGAKSVAGFTCPWMGIYPDPENCHNFYICDYTLNPYQGSCMSGLGTYDSASQVCRVTPCSGPPATTSPTNTFACPAVGLFADPTNCHNFYSCDESLNPIPGTCLKGQGSFDPINKVCSVGPCPTAPPKNPEDFTCLSEGFFADPNDCHAFYSCNNQLVAVHSTCTSNAYFDPDKICVIGTCENVATTTTATTGGSGTATFQCTSPGYFPDTKNCRGYYFCDNALNSFHGLCMGGGGYYDAKSGGCVVGSC